MNKYVYRLLSLVLFASIASCTTYSLEEDKADYLSLQNEQSEDDFANFAPTLKIYDAQVDSNKVGTPKANADGSVYIDSADPAVYTIEQSFQVEDRQYTNLVYRVHFSDIPFSIFPYHLSWGKNVGLIFVVTLNENQEPILFTTAHTCGCYMAMMGTSHTPESFFPEDWTELDSLQYVYGERLPHKLDLSETKPDICVAVRPHVHRIMDVFACDKSDTGAKGAQEFPLQSLRTLDSENGPVSFFYEDGYKEGLVKGAIKPWETMFLSWVSLDPFVGTDKAFLRKETSDRTFYTSIKPWRREISDMADFPQFLEYWGWSL